MPIWQPQQFHRSAHNGRPQRRSWYLAWTALTWLFGATPAMADNVKDALNANRDVQVAKAQFTVAVFPKTHRLDIVATMHMQSKRTRQTLKLFLPQIIQLKQASLWRGTRKQTLRVKRQLATATLVFPKGIKGAFRIQVKYHITFHSRKNYLFRAIFCRIDPDESYLLYGWYPSLHPFADPMTGRLLGAKRYPYELRLEVPKGQIGLSAGPLVKKTPLRNGRTRFVYRQSAIKEAAIFFSSSRFRLQKRKTKTGTQLHFYLHPQDKGRNIPRLVSMMDRTQRLYERLWGRPVSSAQAKRGGDRQWRLISFGGSGARGYPFALLLDRSQNYFDGELDAPVDSLFTRRQVLLHEMAHTWWGNAVTGVGKGSIWLNEGLANYAALRAIGALYGAKAEAAAVARHVRYFLQGKGSAALLAPGGLSQMAGRIAYTKGALLFYELERRLGRAVVERGLRRFFQRHRGSFVTIKQIKQNLERAAGRSLSSFFRDWVHGEGLPFVQLKKWKKVKGRCQGTCQLTATLHNSGNIAGSAIIRATSAKGRHKDIVLAGKRLLQAGKTLRITIKLPFIPTRLQLDPDGQMLHGLRLHALMSLANRLRRSQQYAKATPLFQRLLALAPNHGQALYSFGLLQQKRNKWQRALALYLRASQQKAGKWTPSWVPLWAHFRYAALLLKRGNKAKARRILKQLQRQPNDPYGLKARISTTLQR